MSNDIRIRIADRSDRDALRAMQALSIRILGAPYYETEVIESFITDIGTMDDTLLDDGTYFAAVDQGQIVGCGGWSWRTPTYALRTADGPPVSSVSHATVRSVYVHPAFARRGIARSVMAVIEADIVSTGFNQASLVATLSGIPLYRRLGWRPGEPVTLRLRAGGMFVGLNMRKTFVQQSADLTKAA